MLLLIKIHSLGSLARWKPSPPLPQLEMSSNWWALAAGFSRVAWSSTNLWTVCSGNARRRFRPYGMPNFLAGSWLRGYVWTLTELSDAQDRLKTEILDSMKFGFFTDGLDEYQGDRTEVIAVINDFAFSRDMKVCFSSRLWHVFEQAHGDNSGLKLRLQELARGDVSCFVTERLAEERQFKRLRAEDDRYSELVNEIVDRAHGVFLWLFILVQCLRQGITDFDTISESQRRLRMLPTELEGYFQHLLDSVGNLY